MLFSSLSWVIFTFVLLVALPGALASSSPKRSKKTSSTRVTVETYPAMEEGEIRPARAALPPAKDSRVQTLGALAPYVVQAAPTPTSKFEVVPAEKRSQVLQRIRLCQSLFEETGRAYDYRSMTTAELQKELDAVRANTPPVAVQNPERDPILDAQE